MATGHHDLKMVPLNSNFAIEKITKMINVYNKLQFYVILKLI